MRPAFNQIQLLFTCVQLIVHMRIMHGMAIYDAWHAHDAWLCHLQLHAHTIVREIFTCKIFRLLIFCAV